MKLIAELCQNHNGSVETLIKMVESAAISGATHVKIQHISANMLTFRPIHEIGYSVGTQLIAPKRPYQAEYDRLKSLELSPEHILLFIEACRSHNVIPLTTCFTHACVHEILSYGFNEIKVASYDCSSYPLLRRLASSFKHLYISTGSTFRSELEHAVRVMKEQNASFDLLHCTTIYPTPFSHMNYKKLEALKRMHSGIGFSDHSAPSIDGVVPTLMAIFYGAKTVERHFTILDPMETRDGLVSVNPSQLAEIASFFKYTKDDQQDLLQEKYSLQIPDLDSTENDEVFSLTSEELANRNYYRGRFASVISRNEASLPVQVIYNHEEWPYD